MSSGLTVSWSEPPKLPPVTMLERVTDALDAALKQAWLDVTAIDPEQLARVAMQMMHEPTEEMYEALNGTDKLWRELDSTTVWKTMLAGALR